VKEAVTPWVLSRAPVSQTVLIRRSIDRALDALPAFVCGNVPEAMKLLHTRDGLESEPDS
jgi:hypothetical protein